MDKIYYQLKRETSKYNKYMKWHLSYFREDKSLLSSDWFRTEKSAQSAIELANWNAKRGFPIGDKIIFYEYLPLEV